MRTAILLLAIGTFLLSAGCSREEATKTTVVSQPEAEVEVTHERGGESRKIEVTTKEGTAVMTVGVQSPPKDIDVPIYPGAEQAKEGTWSMSQTEAEGRKAMAAVRFFSQDPVEEVAAFYKEELKGNGPSVFEMTIPEGRMVTIAVEREGQKETSIVLMSDKETAGTHIQIYHVQE